MQSINNELADIDDFNGLDSSDHACLEELKALILKHGLQSKYGISLLHRHFDLSEDEVLVERVNVANRTSVATAEVNLKGKYFPTQWRLH